MSAPGYWINETSGVLRPVVENFLKGRELSPDEVGILRAYFRQWIAGGWCLGPEIDGLRDAVDSLTNTANLRAWVRRAVEIGIDPL